MAKGISIAGRKVNDGVDFYQTPRWAIEKLLEVETFDGDILEPCSGGGAISMVLEEYGYNVSSQDIRDDKGVYGKGGEDFFNYEGEVDNIVTNPPYFCAKEFVEKALEVSNGKVAMLLKLSFLEGAKRYEFFQSTPLKYVYVFCKRVTMYPANEEKAKKSGTIAYAWYIWEKGYEGEATIKWLL